MVNLTLKFSIVEIGSLIKIKDLVFGQVLTMTFVQMNQIFSDFSMKNLKKIFTKNLIIIKNIQELFSF